MKDLKMVLFLLILSSLCALVLGGTEVFYEKASVIFNLRLYQSVLELFNQETPIEEVDAAFSGKFSFDSHGGRDYFLEKETGVVVFKADGPGLWSRIEILLALNPDFESLYGLKVLSQAETPGLGGRIAEPEFQESFRGIEVVPSLRIVKFASAANEVDAVTGASKTCEALEKIINKAVAEARQAYKKGL